MDFTLDPTTLANLLTEPLGTRPKVISLDDGVLVSDPLPLKVVVAPSPSGCGFEVHCVLGVGNLSRGVAFMAANAVNLAAGSARVRVFAEGDDVTVVADMPVYGPIQPAFEFAHAIEVVLESLSAFGENIDRLSHMLDAVATADVRGCARPGRRATRARRTADARGRRSPTAARSPSRVLCRDRWIPVTNPNRGRPAGDSSTSRKNQPGGPNLRANSEYSPCQNP